MTKNVIEKGELEVMRLNVPYISAPINLFSLLCQSQQGALLLESAEIDSKKNVQSLMLIDAAVRIACEQDIVTLEALTQNGEYVLDTVCNLLACHHTEQRVEREGNQLRLIFPVNDRALDEDARLHQPSSLDALRFIQQAYDTQGLPKEALFIGGLFAYDLVEQFEPLPSVDATSHCPDYVFYVAETLLIIDHQNKKTQLQASLFGGERNNTNNFVNKRLNEIKTVCSQSLPMPPSPEKMTCAVTESVSDTQFCETVSALKSHVVLGDVFQVVPSRQFVLPCPSPLSAYAALKVSNPSPYMFYMQDKAFTLFGASPESALKYDCASNQVEIYPIAGTRPRGKYPDGTIDLDLDGRIEVELRNDEKENAEHMMLVDLARNDVARISQAGTRYVADLLKVDRYSHVMHLVSRVVGQLRTELDALHAYQACMNMGTLTGAPKIRAMQLIREVEQQRRGSYGGAVGYITGQGDMDTCIVIRSAYVEDGIAYVQAGAGVVFDSDPLAEANETRSKAQAVISAIKTSHQGDQQ